MSMVELFLGLDDAALATSAAMDRSAPGEMSIMAEAALMSRSAHMHLIIVSQAYWHMSHVLRANLHNLVVLRTAGDDLRALGTMLRTDTNQEEFIATLPRGEALVYSPSLCAWPVRGTFEPIFATANEAELERRNVEFLSQIVAVKGGKRVEKERAWETLTAEEARVLVGAAERPEEGCTGVYVRSGLDRAQGRKVVERLRALGLVLPHKIATGSRGGGFILLEVTDLGWQELARRGVPRQPRPCRGGWLHGLAATVVAEIERARGHEVRFEVEVRGVYADVVSTSRDGQMIVWQIGMSSDQWEAKNADAILAAPGVHELIVVVRDTAMRAKIGRRIEGMERGKKGRLRLVLLGELLKTRRASSN